jgi:hypothetical protein
MAIALERRLRKLERFVGCPNPEHAASVLFVGEELTAEEHARIESIKQCLRCRDRQLIIFKTNVPEDED